MNFQGIEFLRSMRKRRVGVTARSRQNVGNQVTGTLQFDTEMAAPLELRTPAGTLRQRLQTECGWKHGDKGAGKSTGRETIKQNMQREREEEVRRRKSAPKARMRRCLKLGQGAKPPETPAPFPSGWRIQNGENPSRVRKPRNNGAPLTDSLRSESRPEMRERGHSGRRESITCTAKGTARYARMRRCLKLRQGASPLRPPPPGNFFS